MLCLLYVAQPLVKINHYITVGGQSLLWRPRQPSLSVMALAFSFALLGFIEGFMVCQLEGDVLVSHSDVLNRLSVVVRVCHCRGVVLRLFSRVEHVYIMFPSMPNYALSCIFVHNQM
ncbi:hypothetical protein Y032_0199g1657 [Ancylostoma ceylanicum]|uniref:Uncharacterized protein n=1 Tax=Ancylostoma ceylanicum TaxID=53326 RepID=A0A016SNP9_9BILA|nr:hypothetical protein Y032_0199g1657 [Ancylostoma ceylanicum]